MKKVFLLGLTLCMYFFAATPSFADTPGPPAATIAQISAGNEYSVAILTDGSMWSWGTNNDEGQLGNGTTLVESYPMPVGTDTDWQTVATGYQHTVAIKTDGTLWAWGNNSYGQLGDNTTETKLVPTRIGTENNWETVYCGRYSTLAIKVDGTLWAWGDNEKGQLGNEVSPSSYIPVRVGLSSDWQAIITGDYHTFGIKADDTLWAWGDNEKGQLGDNTTEIRYTPVQIGLASEWQTITAGQAHTVAIKTDGTLWAWGDNEEGQLGVDLTESETHLEMSSSDAVSSSDSVQMSNGYSSRPVRIGTDTNWKTVSAGRWKTVAVKTTNTLWGWGAVVSSEPPSPPAQIGTNTNWQNVTAGSTHNVALTTGGTLAQWGTNTFEAPTSIAIPAPDGDGGHELLASGGEHILFIRPDGTLWAYGRNNYCQLGIGKKDSASHLTPIQISTDKDWQSVAAGARFSMAMKTDGTIWTWGVNGQGELGNGTLSSPQCSPMPGPAGNDWQKIYAGEEYGMAIKTDGTLWAWGLNHHSSLGNGLDPWGAFPNPGKIGNDHDWQTVTCGIDHNLALKKNGTLWAWGGNWAGVLGDGTENQADYPIQITTYNGWKNIGTGTSHSLGILTDGTLWRWGSGWYGLGIDGTDNDFYVPTQVGNDTNWLVGNVLGYHAMAIRKDGTLWGVGRNDYGQLGDGTTDSPRWSWVKSTVDTDWLKVSDGKYGNGAYGLSSAALKTDGTFWAWGKINWQHSPTLIEFPIACRGDFDRDGDVDGYDAALIGAEFGSSDCSECLTDLTYDDNVTEADLEIFASSFGCNGADKFQFVDKTNAEIETLYYSNSFMVTGIEVPVSMFIAGGEYNVNNTGWASGLRQVNKGDTVQVRRSSSAQYSTTVSAVLTIGGVSDSFDITTRAGSTEVNPFSFTDRTDVEPGITYDSINSITVTGPEVPVAISITGGEYNVNSTGWTTAAGEVNPGDVVQVRCESSAQFDTMVSAVLTIGGVKDSFDVTTRVVDDQANPFSFVDKVGVELSTMHESNTIMVTGVEIPVSIAIVDGEYKVDNLPWTSASGEVKLGDLVQVRRLSSAEYSTMVQTILTIGGQSDSFDITTRPNPIVITPGDRDGDGVPDVTEIAEGSDPDDPYDPGLLDLSEISIEEGEVIR